MQAIILAGGFGTRLQSAIGPVPKPMAPVAGRPFLCWLLDYMAQQGVSRVVLCVHYQAAQIRDYFGARTAGMSLSYATEATPLGTGGAIRQGLTHLDSSKPVIVLNGDSLVQVDYFSMLQTHYRSKRPLTIATRRMPDCSRYSLLEVEQGSVKSYKARGTHRPGIISNGLYIVSPGLFDGYTLPAAFSFEQDFLAPHCAALQPASHTGVNYFIDIGVPEDYARAQVDIPLLLDSKAAA